MVILKVKQSGAFVILSHPNPVLISVSGEKIEIVLFYLDYFVTL